MYHLKPASTQTNNIILIVCKVYNSNDSLCDDQSYKTLVFTFRHIWQIQEVISQRFVKKKNLAALAMDKPCP